VFKDEIYGSTFFPVTSKYMKSAGLFWRCVSFFLYRFEYKCLIKANNIQVERGENFLSNGIKSFFPQLRLWKNTEVDICAITFASYVIWSFNIFDCFVWTFEHLSVNWYVLYDNLVNNVSSILYHLFTRIFHKIINGVVMQYNSVNKYPHDNDLDNIFFVKKELFFLYQLSSSMLDLSSCFFETVIIYTKNGFFCINKW